MRDKLFEVPVIKIQETVAHFFMINERNAVNMLLMPAAANGNSNKTNSTRSIEDRMAKR